MEMGSFMAATGIVLPLEAATKHLSQDFGVHDQSQVVALNYFTVASLQQYVGTNFTVQDTPKTSVTFSLAAVKTLSQRSMGPAIDGFTMQFRQDQFDYSFSAFDGKGTVQVVGEFFRRISHSHSGLRIIS